MTRIKYWSGEIHLVMNHEYDAIIKFQHTNVYGIL